MRKFFTLSLLVALFTFDLGAQTEYKVLTVVESIVPAGIGRSRIIEATDTVDSDLATTERTDGKKSNMDEVRRGNLKVDLFNETKLLNFFSLGGINFQNVASNDAMITDKINKLTAEGWELAFVSSGVESNAGEQDREGIFITRFIFKMQK